MTPAERQQILGAETVAEIHERVAKAPPLVDEDVISTLRRILTRPACRTAAPEAARRAA